MVRSQRLRGLELLRVVGAPVPNWQIVKNPRDIRRLKLPQVKFGWTIRTCRRNGGPEFGLYNSNYVDRGKVGQLLREQLNRAGKENFYIVYPSWRFRFSCNIVLRDQNVCVEGVYGSQKGLASGKSSPDFGLWLPFGFRSKMTYYGGMADEEVHRWLGSILWFCKRIPWESLYTEVAVTQAQALVFYELFELGDPK